MMIQRKTTPRVSTTKTTKTAQPVNHWAFLDEIEAPMWADLNLEGTSCYKDNDDDWFHISHPVHQCSSREIKSALSRAGEAKAQAGFGLEGLSSPKLPPSVSRSRGKDYKSKDWTRNNGGTIASKQHPIKNLNGKSSWGNSGSGQKLKSKPSDDNGKGSGRSKATSVCESSLTESYRLNSTNPTVNTAESKTTSSSSTITYENSLVSNQGIGQTSDLLSSLKVTLRKSCVRRQALRVERVHGRQSRGCTSSSGKSSVGSSSHPGYDARYSIGGPISKSKDATPDSRKGNGMPYYLEKQTVLTTSKKYNSGTLATKCGGKIVTTKSATDETAKLKVSHFGSSKVMRNRRGNESLGAATITNCKTETRRLNKLGMGKENANTKTRAGVGGFVQVQKAKKPTAPLKVDKPWLIGPKVKVCSQDEKKSATNVIRNIHFR